VTQTLTRIKAVAYAVYLEEILAASSTPQVSLLSGPSQHQQPETVSSFIPGGGWFAAERSATRIAVWFWSRQDTTVPAAVKNGASPIYTDSFGVPMAVFSNTSSCNLAEHFGPHRVIINTSLCGGEFIGTKGWIIVSSSML